MDTKLEERKLDEESMPPIEFKLNIESPKGGKRWYTFSPITQEMIIEALQQTTPLKRKLFLKKIKRAQLTEENIKKFILESIQ